MEQLPIYFIGVFAYNAFYSLVAFAIIYYTRRRERVLTPIRGLAVLLIGWAFGSLLVLVFHLLFALGGTEVQGGPFEAPVSILMVLSAMYAVFGWLSTKKVSLATYE